MITIHVDQEFLRRNRLRGTRLPPLVVHTDLEQPTRAMSAVIHGPSKVVYDEHNGLQCRFLSGARLWLETEAEVTLEDPVAVTELELG